jgi:CheY-like chemotaxis protein/PAS domain-containing protein
MPKTLSTTRILALARPESHVAELVNRLAGDARIHLAKTFDDALQALREGAFDLVVSDHGDFAAFEQAAANQQSVLILDNIGQGVCIVDPRGNLIWANPKMKTYSTELIERVCKSCRQTIGELKDLERNSPAFHRARRLSINGQRDEFFELTITPILNADQDIVQIAAVMWDVTLSRRLQKKLDAIDAAGRELCGIDAQTLGGLNVEERISLLEKKMLRFMHELLHFDDFAVLLIDKKTNRLEFVLQHGMTAKTRDYDIFASPENNGISGYVAATGRSYICHDTSKDPRYLQGLEAARSSLTVPLRLNDKIIGVLNIESDRPAAFNEDDRQYAEILARSVAMALHILNLLVVERNESTGRIADDVIEEIAGPLNDILTDASTLMEDYIGQDDLRHRLNEICDRVAEVKQKIKDVTAPRGGLLGRRNGVVSDPILAGMRILIADDEEIIRETIGGVLKKCGCHVQSAADGEEAIRLIERHGFDLVMADIRMPLKNGYEVFAAARGQNADLPVILMTGFGYDPNHSIVRASKEGLAAVLFKPFKVDQLLSEARSALARTRQ